MHDVSQFVAGKCQSGHEPAAILQLSRFSAGLPLLIPTDRAAPSYQLLVLSLARLPFVLFVAITDIFWRTYCGQIIFGHNIRPPLDKRTAAPWRSKNVNKRNLGKI